VNDETVAIKKGDAVPIRMSEMHSFTNDGTEDLEFMIIGIAEKKGQLGTLEVK
jgi:mannose-6-phosphate isomerase-like protein (cupin superfamily)